MSFISRVRSLVNSSVIVTVDEINNDDTNNNVHQTLHGDTTSPPINNNELVNVGGEGDSAKASGDPPADNSGPDTLEGTFNSPIIQRSQDTSKVTTVPLPDEGWKDTATIACTLTQHSSGRRLANSGNTTHTGLVEESNGLNIYNDNPFGNNNNPVPSLLRSIRGHKLAGIHRLTSFMKETLVWKSDPPMMDSSSNISVPYEGEIMFSDEPSTHHPTMDPPGIDMSEPTSQDCVIPDTDDDMGSDLPIPQDSVPSVGAAASTTDTDVSAPSIPQDSVSSAGAAPSTPDTDGSIPSASQVSVTPVSTAVSAGSFGSSINSVPPSSQDGNLTVNNLLYFDMSATLSSTDTDTSYNNSGRPPSTSCTKCLAAEVQPSHIQTLPGPKLFDPGGLPLQYSTSMLLALPYMLLQGCLRWYTEHSFEWIWHLVWIVCFCLHGVHEITSYIFHLLGSFEYRRWGRILCRHLAYCSEKTCQVCAYDEEEIPVPQALSVITMSVTSVSMDLSLFFGLILTISLLWLGLVLLLVVLLSVLIIVNELPGIVLTIYPDGQPFWHHKLLPPILAPYIVATLLVSIIFTKSLSYHHTSPYLRLFLCVRRAIQRVWWTVRYLHYPAVKSSLLRFHRQVLRRYYKSWSRLIRPRYYQGRRLFCSEMKKLCSSLKSRYRCLRLSVRTLIGLGPPSRRRSSRGYCNWGSRLRRHLAYELVLKCLSRVFDLLTGSVHWRHNQRRLVFNRASQQRSHTCLQVNGGSGRLPARPGFFIVLDSLRWWLIKGIYNWLYAAAEFFLVYFDPPPSTEPPDRMHFGNLCLRSFLRYKFRGNEGILWHLVRTLHHDMDDGEFCHEAEFSQAFQEPHSAEYSVFDGESSVSEGESSVSDGESSVSEGEYYLSEGEYYLSEGDNTLSSGQKELLLWYWSHIDSDDSLVSGGDNVAFDASISPNLRSDRLTMLARSIQTVRKVQKEPSGKFKKFKA